VADPNELCAKAMGWRMREGGVWEDASGMARAQQLPYFQSLGWWPALIEWLRANDPVYGLDMLPSLLRRADWMTAPRDAVIAVAACRAMVKEQNEHNDQVAREIDETEEKHDAG